MPIKTNEGYFVPITENEREYIKEEVYAILLRIFIFMTVASFFVLIGYVWGSMK
jgi:hypothetical protein